MYKNLNMEERKFSHEFFIQYELLTDMKYQIL